MKVLLIGERANRRARKLRRWDWRTALRCGAFRDAVSRERLARIDVRVEACDSVNLLPPNLQGVPWDRSAAKRVAEAWLPRLEVYNLVFLVGAKVSAAFGLRGRVGGRFGKMTQLGEASAVVIPHPSGLNRFWNDPGDVRRLRRAVSRVAEGRR